MDETTDERDASRLAALGRYEILGTPPERAYDDLTAIAANICGAPIALISLVDRDRQWFKSRVGLDVAETGRDVSFCAHAIRRKGLFVVPDALRDERFATNPLVVSDPKIRFYASSPLVVPGGEAIGTLCVIDRRPRTLSPEQAGALEALGRQVVAQMELHRRLAETQRTLGERDRTAAELRLSRARKAAILEAALDCIIAVDHEGRIAEFNAAAERTFGYDRSEAIGRPMHELIIPPEIRRLHLEGIARSLATGASPLLGERVEVPAMRRDGSKFPAELAIAAIRQDGPPAFVAHLRDITQRKQAEAALVTLNDGLERRVAERTAELARANDALRAEVAERRRAEEALILRTRVATLAAEVASALSDGETLGGALQHCVEALTRHLDAASARIWTLDEGEGVLRLRAGAGLHPHADGPRSRVPVGHGEIGLIAREGRPYYSDDLASDPRFDDAGWAASEGLTAFAGQPLIVEGKVIGVMALLSRAPLGEAVSAQLGAIAHGIAVGIARKRAEAEVLGLNARLEQRLQRLDSLRQIDVAISSSLDLKLTLGIVLDQVLARLHVDAGAILLASPHNRGLSFSVGKGFRTDGIAATSLRHGEGLPGRASREERPVAIADLSRPGSGFARSGLLAGEGFVAYHAVPLMAKGQVLGVLEVFHRSRLEPDRDWLAFLENLAGQAAIAIDNAALFRDLQRSHAELVAAYDATIEGWARAIDLRDKETEGHTRRVTEMSVMLARAMGVGEADLLAMRRGAMLHDIGKLAIPDDILLKPGRLTEAEWEVMRRHPEYAYEWLAPIAFLRPALDIPRHHHERWDGTGYPLGLAGEQIPLAARIFAAVDIWDALRSDRPYRAGWDERRVIDHLRSLSGTHLDPRVVDAFLSILTGSEEAFHGPAEAPAEARTVMLEYQLQRANQAIRQMEERHGEQAQEISRLAHLSHTDDLTGLNNRRHFRESLEAAFSLACRRDKPLSVILLDLDGFKSYNDEHGHPAGDEVLRALASVLHASIRPGDSVARHGGEEFAVLLPDADAVAARAVAERLRAAVAVHPWPFRSMTASLGVSTSSPFVLEAAEIVEAADEALYHSKRRGRDRVTHYDDMRMIGPLQAVGPGAQRRRREPVDRRHAGHPSE